MSSVPLSLTDISKSYPSASGPVKAVSHVSFDVKEGEIFGLLGPNGAGKTTIISMITTLEEPTEGVAKVFGVNVQERPRLTKSQVGVVPQEIINHGFFDIEEILTFHSGYFGLWKNKERVDYLLHKLSLWSHRKKKVKQLSGGMKRRLLIAKALVHSPKLLLLDEPTAGVDIELRESLWRFVLELKSQGVSVLLTTHYLQEAENLCDRLAIIHKGELREVGQTREIISRFTKRSVVLEFSENVTLSSSPYLAQDKGPLKTFLIPSEIAVGKWLFENQIPMNKLVDIRIKEGSLEEAFTKVLGNHST